MTKTGYLHVLAKATPPESFIVGDLKLLAEACPGIKPGDRMELSIVASVHSVETDKFDVTTYADVEPKTIDGPTWIIASILEVEGSARP